VSSEVAEHEAGGEPCESFGAAAHDASIELRAGDGRSEGGGGGGAGGGGAVG